MWQRGNEPEKGVTPLLHGLPPLPGGITPPFSSALAPPEPPAAPSSRKRMHETLPHAAPQFADSIHPPPLLGLPVYVVTWFHYLFLALISEAFILLGFGRVSTASFWALKSSLYKSGLRPSRDRALVWATSCRLFILLAGPGGAGVPHRPASTVATNRRKRHDLRFHLAQPSLSNGETETQRSES